MSFLKKEFGYNLKLLRKSRNLTQEQLAEMINLNQRQLTRMENGISFVSADVLERLVVALDIDIKDLFDFKLKEVMLKKVGTYDMPYYRIVQKDDDTSPVLQKFSSKSDKSTIEETQLEDTSDNYLSDIAKNMQQPIQVQQQENGATKTYIYYPDGNIELVENNLKNDKIKKIEKLLEKIKKLADNESQLNYLNLALESLTDKTARQKLKNLIEGMELIQK